MATYSKFLELQSGVARTVDLSSNTLNVQALEVGSILLSQTGAYASFSGTIAGTSTSVVITAYSAGVAGNSIALMFNGSTTISAQIAAWNLAHSNNRAVLTSGDGTQTPSSGTTTLSGGVSSGSSLIGDESTYNNFTPTSATVAGALSGIDSALAGLSTSAITSLTGDVTASGPGAAAATLATVNSNIGSFGSSTSIPSFTVNAKGLITAASGNAVVAPAGTLSGTTLNSSVVSSSLTSVGTITSGTWNGTTIAIANGGTGQVTAAAAYNALSPMTTAGDIEYEVSANTAARLPIGTTGQILTVVSGAPAWATPATSGTVTSVAFADDSSVPIYSVSGSPVTSSGTLAITLATQAVNSVFAGPASGSSAQPAFRSLVLADIPSLSSVYLPLAGGTMSGAINMGNHQINNLSNGTSTSDAINLGQLQSAISGLFWQGPAQAYAASDVALTGSTPLVVDGYTALNGDLLILGNQTTASQNGEYSVAITGGSYVLTANGLPSAAGDAWLILNGTLYGDTAFVANAAVPAATFTEFAGPTAYTFSPPLSLSGRTVSISQATTSTNGYLSSTDWNTFNDKQAAGNYITALTGDASASGPGSAALTLATVNSNVGSFGSSTSIPSFTVNAKGLITAASGNAVVAPAGTLSGTTLNSSVVSSSLTSVGTITTGTWTGTTIAIAHGGTGQVTAQAAFDALSPLATAGDTLYYNGSHNVSLPIGSTGQVLTVVAGEPSWAAPAVSPGSITLTQNHILVGDASNLAADIAMYGDVAIVASGATTIQSGAVTASKLATVTDGITLDQSGSGSTLEIKSGGVTETQINNSTLSSTGALAGGSGTKLSVKVDSVTVSINGSNQLAVLSSPRNSTVEISDQALTANTLYALRYERSTDAGGIAGNMWKADNDATTSDLFYVVGLAYPTSSVSALGSVTVVESGIINVPSHGFTPGLPLYLGSSGACTTTAPTAALSAIVKVGIVKDANNILVQSQVMGIN